MPGFQVSSSGGGGVTDHGDLTGLADDDHTQYATNVEFDDHDARHEAGGADEIDGNLNAVARTTVRKNSGADVGSRRRLNLIEGANVTLTVADDSANEEVDITIAATGAAGAPSTVDYLVGTADAGLSNEIVVGTSPGGELGGTWASPTVDATHAGSTHSAATDAHIADATDAHDASAISIVDAGNDFTATDVEGALDELQADNEAHVAAADPHTGYRLESADHSHQSTGAQAGQLDHGLALTGLTDDDHTQYILKSLAAAKGDLFTATANDTPAILGVGADGLFLKANSGTATGLEWAAGGSGAPADVDYLVGTASGGLSAEIVVGTTPGGELGGTWASPTVDATHSGSAHITAAAQADQETATSNTVAVTPGVQQFHPSAAKFWVRWTGASTTILVSYNMTSIANTGTGDADGTIATDFSGANWCGMVTTQDAGTDGWDADSIQSSGFNAMAAGTFGVLCGFIIDGGTAAAALTNPDQWMVLGFGDQ